MKIRTFRLELMSWLVRIKIWRLCRNLSINLDLRSYHTMVTISSRYSNGASCSKSRRFQFIIWEIMFRFKGIYSWRTSLSSKIKRGNMTINQLEAILLKIWIMKMYRWRNKVRHQWCLIGAFSTTIVKCARAGSWRNYQLASNRKT